MTNTSHHYQAADTGMLDQAASFIHWAGTLKGSYRNYFLYLPGSDLHKHQWASKRVTMAYQYLSVLILSSLCVEHHKSFQSFLG